MKWCVECGEVGKPEPAVTEVDGDPLCAGHAKARGIETYGKLAAVEKPVFNAEFIERKMAEHKGEPATPSAPKEKVMAKCKCGCGQDATVGRFYAWGHKPKNDKPAGVQISPKPERKQGHSALRFNKATQAIEKFDPHATIQASIVDLVWNALPEAQKRAALRSLLDSII